MGAGSTVFAKNVLGDCLATPPLADSEIALYDIDPQRLADSRLMLENLDRNAGGKARIAAYTREGRREALRGADFVVNAIQVGGYEPCTVTDFEVPKKYGLRQTIGDTLGIGGIFRALRTIPVMLEFAREMEEVCPEGAVPQLREPHGDGDRGAAPRAPASRRSASATACRSCAEWLVKGVGMAWDPAHALEDRGHQPPGVAAGDLPRRAGPLPGDQAPIRRGAGSRHRPGAPRDHAPVRLLRHREQRAHRGVRAVVHQGRAPRADRALHHPPRRVPAALRGPDRGMEAHARRAGREPLAASRAHGGVRVVHHGGGRHRPAVQDRRQRAERRHRHEPPARGVRGGAVPRGRRRGAAAARSATCRRSAPLST